MRLHFKNISQPPLMYDRTKVYVNPNRPFSEVFGEARMGVNIFDFRLDKPDSWSRNRELNDENIAELISYIVTMQPEDVYVNLAFERLWASEQGEKLLSILKSMCEKEGDIQ